MGDDAWEMQMKGPRLTMEGESVRGETGGGNETGGGKETGGGNETGGGPGAGRATEGQKGFGWEYRSNVMLGMK
jgi:hypothetical protein